MLFKNNSNHFFETYNIDCIEGMKIHVKNESVDLIFTDPPYGVDYSEKNTYLNAISRGNRIQTPIENDNNSIAEMKDLLFDKNYWFMEQRKENWEENP